MFIYGTYVGIASGLFSAFICWRCFRWRRRFPVATFTACGTLAFFACLWSFVVTITESGFSSGDSVQRTFDAWRQSGSITPDITFDAFRNLINARNSSMIISNVVLSFIVSAAAGLVATATFGRAAHNQRQHSGA